MQYTHLAIVANEPEVPELDDYDPEEIDNNPVLNPS
jgi:hypothetical protein